MKRAVILLAVVCFLAACGGGGGTSEEPELDITSTSGAATIYGNVIDMSSRQPVAGATAKLFIKNGEQSADTDENGYFEFQGVAAGTLKLRVEASGYAVYERWLTVDGSSQGAYYFAAGDDGKVVLARGCDVEAYVTAEGAVVPGAYVYANAVDSPEIGGTSDDSGRVLLSGLAQGVYYTILAPAFDKDSDGTYDYSTGYANGYAVNNYNCMDSDRTVAIALPRADRDDSIRVIGGSYEKYVLSASYSGYSVMSPNEPFVLVFNYPVNVDDGSVTFVYTRDLVPYSDDMYGEKIGAPISTALSAGGTVLTVTPSEPLIANETYNLVGTIWAEVNNSISYYSGSGIDTCYVFPIDGISDDTAVRADNLNGRTRVAGSSASVYLKFPEYVYGKATITSYTKNGVVTDILPKTISLSLGSSVSVYTDEGLSGCTDGECGGSNAYYTSYLGGVVPALEDDAPGSANSITVDVDVSDYDGNRIQKEFVLPIE